VSTSVTPLLPLESAQTEKGQRLIFYRNRIKTSTGPFLVFQELRVDDLEEVLNLLDSSGFEVFELAQEPVPDPGIRARWTVVSLRTHQAA
jgi:hypothetical protein